MTGLNISADRTQVATSTTTHSPNPQANQGRIPKLEEICLKGTFAKLEELSLAERTTEIRKYQLPSDLESIFFEKFVQAPIRARLKEKLPQEEILEIFKEIVTLCTVREAENTIPTYSPELFSCLFRSMIQKISESKNQHILCTSLSIQSFQNLSQQFPKNEGLHEILGLYYIGYLGDQNDLTLFCTHHPCFIKINLNMSLMCRDGNAKAIAEALKHNTTLTKLDFSSCQLSDADAVALAEALMVNRTLRHLVLFNNIIKAPGVIAIAEALKHNTTLRTLSLGGNRIGESGSKAIAEAIKQNTTLTYLSLENNTIGAEATISIAEALKQNSALIGLDLHGNNSGENGAIAIAEALMVNTTLTTLNLEFNKIGDEGAIAIAEALKHNTTLITLCLNPYRNKVGDKGKKAIAEAITINKTLMKIDNRRRKKES